jgi:hypothetical protein
MERLTLSELQNLIEKELADHGNGTHSIRYGTLVSFETMLLGAGRSSLSR